MLAKAPGHHAPDVQVTPDPATGSFNVEIPITNCGALFDGNDVFFDVSSGVTVIAANQPVNPVPYARYADTAGQLAAPGGEGLAPAGAIVAYAGSTAPAGWLLCDGSPVGRAQYMALFNTIGVAYGAGDGSTTFNVPDLRGRVVAGKGDAASVDSLGRSDGQPLASRSPSHGHAVTAAPAHQHQFYSPVGLYPGTIVMIDPKSAAASGPGDAKSTLARGLPGGSSTVSWGNQNLNGFDQYVITTSSAGGHDHGGVTAVAGPSYGVANFLIKY